MRKMQIVAVALLFLAALLVGAAGAVPIEVRFTNNEVDLGGSSTINLTNQYSSFGLSFLNVYRYIDARDPFSDAPNQEPFAETLGNLGISNGFLSETGLSSTIGRVSFLQPTASVGFDWWEITPNQLTIDFFDASANLLGTFTSPQALDFGTYVASFAGPISFFQFHDSGGFVQIANLRYGEAAAVPEPSTLILLGTGLIGMATLARRRVKHQP